MSVRHFGQFCSFFPFLPGLEFSYLHMPRDLDMKKGHSLHYGTLGQLLCTFVFAPLMY